YARELVTADPMSARATLALMRTLAASGDRAGALDWAQRYERIVRVELEIDPDPAIAALARQLRTEPAVVRSTYPAASTGDGPIEPEPVPHAATARDESSSTTEASPSTARLSILKSHSLRWALASAVIVLSTLFVAALLRGHQH